ncbi:uncharacterized protein LOC119375441 [Rhipicephalus sanguineus]|uniref:uncharacterized protein LOC119375441 n=1 Tax=Rhipicephalus sanguineus TaxID=34632 RepID=UPI00189532C1|nr:uncharacterized protein LOC119375441 [Rhipicephalus sanguineus]
MTSSDLCAALLDFTNAYGSVPHQALLDALRGSGAGDVFTDLIADLCRDRRRRGGHRAGAHTGRSTPGLPPEWATLQPVVDPIIHDVQGEDDAHNILVYADDLTPLAPNPDLLQRRIDRVEVLATSLGLSLNPAKFSSLHLSSRTPVALRDYQPQRFFGRQVGFHPVTATGNVTDDAISQARAILTSMSAPWQGLDVVRTFVYPALNFAMRCAVLTKTDWRRLDDAVRPLVKRSLYLPENASTHYVYGSAAAGAVGLPAAAELSDIFRIDSAFKLLTTADRELRDMALLDAYSVVSGMTREVETEEEGQRRNEWNTNKDKWQRKKKRQVRGGDAILEGWRAQRRTAVKATVKIADGPRSLGRRSTSLGEQRSS